MGTFNSEPNPLEQFGPIDIYLFDQIRRGNIGPPPLRIFDAGCGAGRNLVYFLRQGYEVCGVDADPHAIESVKALAHQLGSASRDSFRCEPLEAITFPEASAHLVISSAVLHFAADDAQFRAMLFGSWRILKPGGIFFCRLASSIGIESLVGPVQGRRHVLPDGSERYLVDEPLLLRLTAELGGSLLDPIKTTVVQGMRSMTTWVIRK
jgi:tellurite methyltransferase